MRTRVNAHIWRRGSFLEPHTAQNNVPVQFKISPQETFEVIGKLKICREKQDNGFTSSRSVTVPNRSNVGVYSRRLATLINAESTRAGFSSLPYLPHPVTQLAQTPSPSADVSLAPTSLHNEAILLSVWALASRLFVIPVALGYGKCLLRMNTVTIAAS